MARLRPCGGVVAVSVDCIRTAAGQSYRTRTQLLSRFLPGHCNEPGWRRNEFEGVDWASGEYRSLCSDENLPFIQGSCVTAQSEPTVVCTTSSFSPNLNSSYALAGVPNDLITALPSEIPDLPSLLLLVIILTVISLALLGCAVLPRCFPERMSGSPMQLYGSLLTKISIGTSGIGFIFALTGELVS